MLKKFVLRLLVTLTYLGTSTINQVCKKVMNYISLFLLQFCLPVLIVTSILFVNYLPVLGILHAFLSSADFLRSQLFQQIISGIPSKGQTVWIQIRPEMLQGMLACDRHENQDISLLNNQCY